MKKTIQHVESDQKEFVKSIRSLTNRCQLWEVWRDFVIMFAIAISNSVDKVHFDKREKMYMQTIKKYTPKEQNIFPELCSLVISALERNSDRDFLGELYMALELSNHWTGQFFTPYSICKTMAEITSENILEDITNKGFITVNDPACGAGALLIAYANTSMVKLLDASLNFQNHILFTAQDIDMITGLMCYIQLSLLGCAGFVKIGNTFTEPMTTAESKLNLHNPESNYWYTPMYFSNVWQYRRIFRSMDHITNSIRHGKEGIVDNKNNTAIVKTITTTENHTELKQNYDFIVESNGQLSLL